MSEKTLKVTRRKFMAVGSALAATPLLAELAVVKAAAAENKPFATKAAPSTLAKGTRVYFIGRGCIGCQTCRTLCPVKAIHLGDGANEIDQNACIHCGTCYEECPTCVITETIV
jgi:ferredoxin